MGDLNISAGYFYFVCNLAFRASRCFHILVFCKTLILTEGIYIFRNIDGIFGFNYFNIYIYKRDCCFDQCSFVFSVCSSSGLIYIYAISVIWYFLDAPACCFFHFSHSTRLHLIILYYVF